MALESNRLLGFIGALLTVVGSVYSFFSLARFFFPSLPSLSIAGASALFGVLSLVGLILFMVAMKGFADDYKDPSIFDNALYWLISTLILGVVAGGVAVAVVFSNLGSIIPALTPGYVPDLPEILQVMIGYFIPVLLVVSGFAWVPAIFNLRAFYRLAGKSGVLLFRAVGLLGVVGALVTLALAWIAALLFYVTLIPATAVIVVSIVGGLIGYVAWILAAKAFYSIRVPTSQTVAPLTSQPSTLAAGQARYCPYCGAENRTDAAFCTYCGKNLQP
jgi:uncharacterized membrane protein